MDAQLEIRALIGRIESQRAELQNKQDDSEEDYADWENEEAGPTKSDEPEVINNDDEIDRLSKALSFLEKAVDELDD